MKTRQASTPSPRMLPSVAFAEGRYLIDLRLRAFRLTEPPFTSVRFDSARGRRWCRQCGVRRCGACGTAIIVPASLDTRALPCGECRQAM
ncbi:MAG: hypothetical protein WD534_15295 [Phycisphaeraceae bacterium]